VLKRRLATQRLQGERFSSAADVVRLLGCVQSQEYAHALWSLGMRTSGLGAAEVQAEFDRGDFLRTHILRPTWHFVAAEDIRWILEVTAPRVQKLNQTIYRKEGLDPATLDRGVALIVEELKGGRYRTRAELGQALADQNLVSGFRAARASRSESAAVVVARRGNDTSAHSSSVRRRAISDARSSGLGLAYIVMHAELEGVICSGTMRGAQQTYALLDERVPRSGAAGSAKEGDAAELARRFFAGHGPASIQDLARWSSLTISQCRDAVDAVKDRLDCVTVDGLELWFGPDPPPSRQSSGALLLPLYDELTLSYPVINFPQAPSHPHTPGEDLFIGSVIIAETNVGTWRRTVKGRKMIMEIALAPGVARRSGALVEAAASKLATFLGKELELTITG
jgi:Winged helix DNA-binding domain